MAFYGQRDPGALVPVDLDIYKGRHAGKIDLARLQIAAGYGHRLDRLIDGSRADGLQFGMRTLTQHSGKCTCNGVRIALRGDFQDAGGDVLSRIL